MSESGDPPKNGSHFQAHGSDPDALAEVLSSATSKISAGSSASGLLSFDCEFASTQWLAVGHCQYEGDLALKRETATDKLILFLPQKGTALIGVGKDEVVSTHGIGVVADGPLQTGYRSSGLREHFVLVVDTQELRRRLSLCLQIACGGSLEFAPEIDLKGGGGRVLDQLAHTLHAGLCQGQVLRQAPLALTAITESVAQVLLETVPHRYSNLLERCVSMPVPRHVRRAIDYMHAHIGDAITLEDLAGVCGVSSRTLQLGFKQFKETSPMAYLQHIRFEKVHEELKAAGSGRTVADIALKWGFSHLGRFGAEYRARFGELPSSTLRTPSALETMDDSERLARLLQSARNRAQKAGGR